MVDINNLENITIDHVKLKALRGKSNQLDVGKKIGVSDKQISNIEQGIRKPSAEGLLRLMILYNISPKDIAVQK